MRTSASRPLFPPITALPALLILFALMALSSASIASAHRVTVFAWVEGGTVHTASQFSRERKVHGGSIEVFDAATGERLLTGRTDDQGEFSFPVPEAARARGSDLRVALKAGEGHAGEWIVPASEYMAQAAQVQSGPAEAAKSASPTHPTNPTNPANRGEAGYTLGQNMIAQPGGSHPAPASDRTASTGLAGGSSSPDQAADPLSRSVDAQALEQVVEQAVDRALERRLAPVTRMLAEQAQAGPSVTEIVGGMGWLVGLAGIGAWLSARKKK